MRWPWQRRRQASPTAPAASGTPKASGVPDAGPTGGPPSPSGWAFHRPLQRTTSREIAIHRGTGIGWTATGRNPVFTATMSHLVSAASYSGVVDGDGGGLGEGTAAFVPTPPAAPPVPTATGWSGPSAATESAPVDHRYTWAGGAPGVPVLRYPIDDTPMPLVTRREAPVPRAAAEDWDGQVGGPSSEPVPPESVSGAAVGHGWVDPRLVDPASAGSGHADDAGTVVDIPMSAGRPVAAHPAAPAVRRSAAGQRPLGLGAPLNGSAEADLVVRRTPPTAGSGSAAPAVRSTGTPTASGTSPAGPVVSRAVASASTTPPTDGGTAPTTDVGTRPVTAPTPSAGDAAAPAVPGGEAGAAAAHRDAGPQRSVAMPPPPTGGPAGGASVEAAATAATASPAVPPGASPDAGAPDPPTGASGAGTVAAAAGGPAARAAAAPAPSGSAPAGSAPAGSASARPVPAAAGDVGGPVVSRSVPAAETSPVARAAGDDVTGTAGHRSADLLGGAGHPGNHPGAHPVRAVGPIAAQTGGGELPLVRGPREDASASPDDGPAELPGATTAHATTGTDTETGTETDLLGVSRLVASGHAGPSGPVESGAAATALTLSTTGSPAATSDAAVPQIASGHPPTISSGTSTADSVAPPTAAASRPTAATDAGHPVTVARATAGHVQPLPWRTITRPPTHPPSRPAPGTLATGQRLASTTGATVPLTVDQPAAGQRTVVQRSVGQQAAGAVTGPGAPAAAAPASALAVVPTTVATLALRHRPLLSPLDVAAPPLDAAAPPLDAQHLTLDDASPTATASVQRAFTVGTVSSTAPRLHRRAVGGHRTTAPAQTAAPAQPAAPADDAAATTDTTSTDGGSVTIDEVTTETAEAPGPDATEGAGGTGLDAKQLADLADALYPRLLRRMRHDILLDRERRGLRTDRRVP